jgi:hypothetical protein
MISCAIVKIKGYNLITWVPNCHNCQNIHMTYDSHPTALVQILLHKFNSTETVLATIYVGKNCIYTDMVGPAYGEVEEVIFRLHRFHFSKEGNKKLFRNTFIKKFGFRHTLEYPL